jgi:RNA polymerase sigma-70 factor (ECF subfamily)
MTPLDAALGQLLDRVAEGDQESMTDLYSLSWRPLAAYIRKFIPNAWDVDDVLQEVYACVWSGRGNYTASRGTPWAWLYVIARSRAVDTIRRQKRKQEVNLPEFGPMEHAFASRGFSIDPRAIRQAMQQLPERHRRLLILTFDAGFSQREIADATGTPLGTVKGGLRSSFKKLKQILTSTGPSDRPAMGHVRRQRSHRIRQTLPPMAHHAASVPVTRIERTFVAPAGHTARARSLRSQ